MSETRSTFRRKRDLQDQRPPRQDRGWPAGRILDLRQREPRLTDSTSWAQDAPLTARFIW